MEEQKMNSLINEYFWKESIWLPENYTWEDYKTTDQVRFPETNDLIYPILIGLLLILVRRLTEKYFLEKLGVKLGLRHGRVNVQNPQDKLNQQLETSYVELVAAHGSKKLSFREIEKLAKKSGLEVRQVERWIRRRYAHHRPSKLNKFSESGWRFICYGSLWISGIFIIVNKPWFWDLNECWYGFPLHNLDSDIWWYYTMSSSFYWSLLFSQFWIDVKRKDFWQMFVHHITTIGLLTFSFVANLTRVGSLVILLHDTADVFLEIGKMAKYTGREKLCDCIFAIFTILWIITRLGIFPCYILNSTLFESKTIIKIFPAYYIFNGMLICLQVLHCFWTYFIFKVAISALSKGQYEDSRSSSDDEYDSKKSH